MKLSFSLPKRSYVVVVTLLILFSLFAYYFWIYLPSREELLVANRVRVLQQIARNFKEKDKVYQKTADAIFEKIRTIKAVNDKINCDSPDVVTQLTLALKKDAVNTDLILVDSAYVLKAGEIAYTNAEITEECRVKVVATVSGIFSSLEKKESFEHYILFQNNALAYSTVEGEALQLIQEASDRSFHIDSLLHGAEESTIKVQLAGLKEKSEVFEPGLEVKLSAVKYKMFSAQVMTYDNKPWTLYALVNAESFEADMKEVPVMMVIIIAVVLLILIFALPLLKLSLISPIERLHRVDVVLSTTSFVICTGLMVLFLLFTVSYRADRQKVDGDLKTLSDQLQSNVQNDLQNIRTLISQLEDEVYRQNDTDTMTDINIFSKPYLNEKLKIYPFLKNLYWLNDSGEYKYQLSTVTLENKKIDPINLGERDYFREISEGRGWRADSVSHESPFYLQSIVSWTNSEKLLVLSVPSKEQEIILHNDTLKDLEVLAASVRFHSIIDPVLPVAYSFCVMDENGQVIFHSDKERNLQENFLAEVDEHKGVLSAIIGKNSVYADVSTGSCNQRIYISPLKHTPWTLVTLYDEAYIESPYLQVISLSVICILIIGAIAFFQLYLFSMFNRRPSKLKKQAFFYDWLWPEEDKKKKYYRVMLYNILLAIVLFIYHILSDLTVFQVLASFLYAIIFANTSVWILLTDGLKEKRSRSKLVLSITLIVCFLIIFSITQYYTREWFKNLSILLLIAAASVLPHLSFRRFDPGTWPISDRLSYRNSYWGMLFTFLFISSVLPAFFLYSAVYQQEQKIWKKHEMFEISKTEEESEKQLKKIYLSSQMDVDELERHAEDIEVAYYQKARESGAYYECLGYQQCDCEDTKTLLTTRWDSLLHKSRPFFTNMFVASNGFVFANGGDEWETRWCDRHGIRMKYHSISHTSEDSVVLATSIGGLDWSYSIDRLAGELFWIGLICLLCAVFFIVRFATNQFFALNLFNNLEPMQIDDAYLETYFEQSYDEGHKHLFVIALPFAGTHRLYGKEHLRVVDVPQLLDENESAKVLEIKNSQVVLEHFSYVIEDTQANKQILDIVEHLLRNQNNIIIVSRLSPSQIIDKYEMFIRQSKDAAQRAELEVQVSKWKDILAGFVKVFYSLLHEDTLKMKYSDDFSIKEMLAYEFRVNEQYFKRVKAAFTQKWEADHIVLAPALEAAEKEKYTHPLKFQDIKEEVLLKIQSMAQPFYYSLWNTCSKEEKYLLYDLAMDGFVNTKNEKGLKKLMEKGLIYYQESLQIMNESFRNFILSTIKESESLAMEKELRQSGTWSLYSSIFLILLLSLIVFISLSQKEIISQFVALLVGLGTAIPYLLRFSGFFSAFTGSKAKVVEQM
ncbi:cache domain-containing protein [Catalinimonas niigatensis]|uniref:cache domain-containing protein n=1 Tax=Catalinimonas niigatensis TaxID=1397264 RepID=UPI002664F8FD|nr:cache domain-containing protein [Catalinimonas niigatensis]WPP49049.1 cache domain-containing protein [Catalinimonas niigatensis]